MISLGRPAAPVELVEVVDPPYVEFASAGLISAAVPIFTEGSARAIELMTRPATRVASGPDTLEMLFIMPPLTPA
jgi:hypothetical protein